jgi:putative transposase
MGRQNRPNIPGAIYHVMNRGNRKAPIFEDDRDRRRFVRILIEEVANYCVKPMAGSLMGNHFHLGVVTPHGNLSEFMQQLQGRFARYSNWRHRRTGHLFQGRFRHVHIEHDIHLLTALCYIFMNPVTAGLVKNLDHYEWSTYTPTVGMAPVPGYLSIDWLTALFPSLPLDDAQRRFRQLMSDPKPVAAYITDCELGVNAETIGQVIRSYTGEQLQVASLPRLYRTALRPPLEALLAQAGNDLGWLIREARVSYGYRNAEIAQLLRVNPATVSKIFCTDRHRRS